MKYIFISFITSLFLVGCSGGGSGTSSAVNTSSTTNLTVSGILLDSHVSGVNYSCGSTTDITDSTGKFTCPINTTVNFTIGDVFLGSLDLGSNQTLLYITPSVLYGLASNNISDLRVLNFIQFVQSLDTDNDATNGIDIDISIRDNLVGSTLDISDSNTLQGDLSTTLQSIGKTLVPQNVALAHYISTLENTLNIALGTEPYFNQQWYIENNTTFYLQNGINTDAHIHPNNYLNTHTGKGIKVAIIDDGLDTLHEDLEGAIVHTFDSTTKSTAVSHTSSNDVHGTSVTGIIGARQNGKGIKGIASNAQIIFIKYKELMSDSETIELFSKAESFGADIINNSWGTGDVSDAVKEKIIDLANNGRNGKGTLIIFASGNEGIDIGNDESSISEVISVGASNKDNLRASYSNYGTNLDVLAPGGEFIGITTLDPMQGNGLASIDENYLLYDDSNGFVGTSASAPVVSGALALLLEKSPDLTRLEVENILKNTADKIGTIRYRNGRNDFYGYGKINLTKIMEN